MNEENEKTISESQDENNNINKQKPNVFFHIMLVLSMVNAGSSFILSIFLGFSLPSIGEMLESGSLPIHEEFTDTMEALIRIPQYYFFITALFWALSFYGALAMWKLRKVGFHSYTLAQLILLLLTAVILGKAHLSLGDIMFTLLFVMYYASIVIFRRKQKHSE